MAKFGFKSRTALGTCHPLLIAIAQEVVKNFDCSVIYGKRGKNIQNTLFTKGLSKKQYPDSTHNSAPSMGIDLAPYIKGKISWEIRQCYFFAGYVKHIGDELTKKWNASLGTHYKFRLGSDWNGDADVNDQTFRDICHFELVDED